MKKSNSSSISNSNSRIFDSQAGDEMNDQMENVQVAVRIRGLNQREQDSLQTICVLKDDLIKGRLTIGHTNSSIVQQLKGFQYDQVFGPNESQQTVFENVGKQMALACLSGYNVCIFAYGQTGAGKTFTMLGNEEEKGLIQRILNFIFAKLKSRRQEYVIQSQYYEIYREEIIDLYQPQKNKNIRVVDDFNGVRVENLSMVQITNHNQAVELIQKGQKNRHIGSTRMNAESSRSHSIFSMTIHTKENDPHTGVVKERSSKLHFVDLAGSERQKQTQATGVRLKEAAQINQSLSTLGIVIHALAEGQKMICYRNSKLTQILKDSLGGNSKTLMIAAVSPSQDSYGETLSTLKFAERAKYIKNKASINEKPSENIDNLKKEIETLKVELFQAQKNQKLQLDLLNSYNIKKNEISNSPLISQEQQNSPVLTEEEKITLIKSVDEFQVWLREFLKESGFLDFIQELRQRMGININDMMCVESARDVDSQQWSSLFQVPVENLKEYIKTIMEFNKFTGMVTGQYDIDLKNKNDQLNSQVHQLKEDMIKKDLQMVDCRNSIINEMKAQSQIGSDSKDQTIAELKSLLDQYVLENTQHLNSVAQMEEDLQRKEEAIGHLHEKITNLLGEIQKLKKKKNYADIELKEINENLLKMNEKSEAKIKQLQNEIDCLQMQNVTIQEELEAEQQKFFIQKEEFERKQERHSTLLQTIEYKSKLIDDLQLEISEERKQMSLLYKNFNIEKELQGVAPFSNLWKFIQNIITDYSCERDQKNHLIEEIQGLCLHESSILKAKSESILLQSRIRNEEIKFLQNSNKMIPENIIGNEQQQISEQQKIENSLQKLLNETGVNKDNTHSISVNRMLNRDYLLEYIKSQNQLQQTWNIVGKQLSDSAKKENNTILNTTIQNKGEDSVKNRTNKFNNKDFSKTKSQSDIRFGREVHSPSPNQQNQLKEYNIGEKQKLDAIQQLIQDNKTLCEGLIIKLEEVDKLKQGMKQTNEMNFKLKQSMESELKKFQDQSQQNQYQLNQQLSQIISFDLIKQNLEDEINNLKEENQYLKQVQADNIQRIEELTKEKEIIEDSNFFYNLESKKFQEKLRNISRENDEYQCQIREQNQILNSNNKKIVDLQQELQYSQSKLIESNQKLIQATSAQLKNQFNNSHNKQKNGISATDLSSHSQKFNMNLKFQTVSPAHKTISNKNGNQYSEEYSDNGNYSPISPKRINLEQTKIDISNQQIENQNKLKQITNSESSEFYSALSSFSKMEAFSHKASQPSSNQNSVSQVKQPQQQNKQFNNIEFNKAKESVQKQLNFNLPLQNNNIQQASAKSQYSAQFSFLQRLEQSEEDNEELENLSLPKFQQNNSNKPNYSNQQDNQKNGAQQQIIQKVSSILGPNSEKKEQKQQLHIQKQNINNQINIQNTLNQIKNYEQKDNQAQQQNNKSASSQLSASNSPSNQSLPYVNNNKKRSFLQLLDQIEEEDQENKVSQIDLIQTTYNNNVDQKKDEERSNEEEEDLQEMINLTNTICKKLCNEQQKFKQS